MLPAECVRVKDRKTDKNYSESKKWLYLQVVLTIINN